MNRSDTYVPFIISWPGGNKTELEKIFKDENGGFTKVTGCTKENDVFKCDYNYRLKDVMSRIIELRYPKQ